MKRILITGSNSYVGTSVEKWLMKETDKYYIETLDLKSRAWKEFEFSGFDVVFHVAGIAHVSKKKSLEGLYYEVNRDLTLNVAAKAKESGVGKFIFMSSMIVYNSKETRITNTTKPNPDNFYGLSKLQAEEGLIKLESSDFRVCIVRPPMIYGPHSKGNFPKLIKFSAKTFLFPNFNNVRSMLFIDNLSNCIKELIDSSNGGIYFPQNSEYVSTIYIVKKIKSINKKRLLTLRFFNFIIKLLRNKVTVLNKIFGDSYYDFDMSSNMIKNNVCNLDQSIIDTVSVETDNE